MNGHATSTLDEMVLQTAPAVKPHTLNAGEPQCLIPHLWSPGQRCLQKCVFLLVGFISQKIFINQCWKVNPPTKLLHCLPSPIKKCWQFCGVDDYLRLIDKYIVSDSVLTSTRATAQEVPFQEARRLRMHRCHLSQRRGRAVWSRIRGEGSRPGGNPGANL